MTYYIRISLFFSFFRKISYELKREGVVIDLPETLVKE